MEVSAEQMAAFIAYARGAGALGYGEAYAWLLIALCRGLHFVYDNPPRDDEDVFRRLDQIAERARNL